MAQNPAAANTTINDLRLAKTSALATRGVGGRMSAKAPATNPATRGTAYQTYRLGMNGGQAVTRQVARVQWLSDNQVLVLPAGLGNGLTDAARDAAKLQEAIYHAIKVAVGDTADPPNEDFICEIDLQDDAESNQWLENWAYAVVMADEDNPGNALPTRSVAVEMEVGRINHVGEVEEVVGTAEERVLYVTIQYGPNATQTTIAAVPLAIGVAAPADALAALRLESVKSLVLDDIAADLGHNFNAVDYNALGKPDMRWADGDCNTRHPLTRYTPKLSLYTTAMIAALNLSVCGGHTILAYARAYGVSAGLLPAAESVHNDEFQFTDQTCEDEELNKVLSEHPVGDAGQTYLRACYSVIAAFGFLHLANDHTYQASSEALIRKAKVAIEACRTTMDDNIVNTLTSDAVLPLAIRTTQHPFGLSSTLGVFRDGQALSFIAEPLVIRSAVVPPQLQRLGIANSEITAMLALPVGDMIRRKFNDQMTALANLQRTILPQVTQYSSLCKHYGHDTQSVLTIDQKNSIDALLPICCAFSMVFGVDAQGQPIGAALSQVYDNVRRDNYALVEMFVEAFEKYRSKGGDLETLLGLKTGTTTNPAAASAAASSAP